MEQMTLWTAEPRGGNAHISGPYRYSLKRFWGSDERSLLWIMLNPSWANAQENDPTLRRLINFSAREGYQRLEAVNLFALINSSPSALRQAQDPIGPDNNSAIIDACARADRVIVAWGNSPFRPLDRFWKRDQEVLSLLSSRELWCFGTTKTGNPLHPLYLRGDRPLMSFCYPTHS